MVKKKIKEPVKLIKYLNQNQAKHKLLAHKTVFTAYDAAATMNRDLNEIIKTLLMKADKDFLLVLLSAGYNIDLKKLEKFLVNHLKRSIKSLGFATEKVMSEMLKIEPGALSAFGGYHRLPVIADKSLSKNKVGVFSSGSFNHSVEMAVKDFIDLERAVLGDFGVKKKIKLPKKVVAKKKQSSKARVISMKPIKKKTIKKKAK